MEIILGRTYNYGIGYLGNLPWECKDDMKIFKEKTFHHIVVCGSNTRKSLPRYLPNRIILTLSRKQNEEEQVFKSLDGLLVYTRTLYPDKKVFIIGGAEIYKYVFENYSHLITQIHMSVFKEEFTCDTFVDFLSNIPMQITSQSKYTLFTHFELILKESVESQYLQLLKNVLKNGRIRPDGRNGETKSIFTNHLKMDLRDGFLA